jgi:predicted esterase
MHWTNAGHSLTREDLEVCERWVSATGAVA